MSKQPVTLLLNYFMQDFFLFMLEVRNLILGLILLLTKILKLK